MNGAACKRHAHVYKVLRLLTIECATSDQRPYFTFTPYGINFIEVRLIENYDSKRSVPDKSCSELNFLQKSQLVHMFITPPKWWYEAPKIGMFNWIHF